jgi:hypothetical protein
LLVGLGKSAQCGRGSGHRPGAGFHDVPELRRLGSDSGKIDLVQSTERLSRLALYFEAGDFRPPPIARGFSRADPPVAS